MVKRTVKLIALSGKLLSRCPNRFCPNCKRPFTIADIGLQVWRSSGGYWYCEDHFWVEVEEEKEEDANVFETP